MEGYSSYHVLGVGLNGLALSVSNRLPIQLWVCEILA